MPVSSYALTLNNIELGKLVYESEEELDEGQVLVTLSLKIEICQWELVRNAIVRCGFTPEMNSFSLSQSTVTYQLKVLHPSKTFRTECVVTVGGRIVDELDSGTY